MNCSCAAANKEILGIEIDSRGGLLFGARKEVLERIA